MNLIHSLKIEGFRRISNLKVCNGYETIDFDKKIHNSVWT